MTRRPVKIVGESTRTSRQNATYRVSAYHLSGYPLLEGRSWELVLLRVESPANPGECYQDWNRDGGDLSRLDESVGATSCILPGITKGESSCSCPCEKLIWGCAVKGVCHPPLHLTQFLTIVLRDLESSKWMRMSSPTLETISTPFAKGCAMQLSSP